MSNKTANTSAETIDVRELEDDTQNVYLAVNVISKRANQLSTKLKEEIKNRLEPYESDGDSLEEIHENREQMEISLMFIPIGIPSWLYGILFVGYSIYGMRAQNDNIGHEAHLGGALAGMLVALLFVPDAWEYNKLIISGVFGATAVFTYVFVKKPDLFR